MITQQMSNYNLSENNESYIGITQEDKIKEVQSLIDFMYETFPNDINIKREDFDKDIWNGVLVSKRVPKGYLNIHSNFGMIDNQLIKIEYKAGILFYNYKNKKSSSFDKLIAANPLNITKKINNIKEVHNINSIKSIKEENKLEILTTIYNLGSGTTLLDSTKLDNKNTRFINSYF